MAHALLRVVEHTNEAKTNALFSLLISATGKELLNMILDTLGDQRLQVYSTVKCLHCTTNELDTHPTLKTKDVGAPGWLSQL